MLLIYIIITCLHFNLYAQPGISAQNIITAKVAASKSIEQCLAYGKKIGENSFDDVVNVSRYGIAKANATSQFISAGLLNRQLGDAFYFKGMYDSAATAFYNSLQILESSRSAELANTHNSLAKLYRKLRDLPKAHLHYQKAMAIYQYNNDSAGIAMIYNEGGVVFEYESNFKKAIEHYTASLLIQTSLRDTNGICYALSNIAGAQLLQNRASEALVNLNLSLKLRKYLNDTFAITLNYADIAVVEKERHNYKTALKYSDSSVNLALKLGYTEQLKSNYLFRSNLYELLDNEEAALNNYKAFVALNDSLFSIAKTGQIEELNVRYETGIKTNKILQQQLTIKQNNITILTLLMCSLLAGGIFWWLYARYKQRKEVEQTELLRDKEEKQLKAVFEAEEAQRMRIASDLHDGVGQVLSAAIMKFNVLQESLTTNKYATEIYAMMQQGYADVRNVSHQLMPQEMLGATLDKAVYLFLKKIETPALSVQFFGDGFDGEDALPHENIMYRAIQELVTNVIKHAKANFIDVSLVRDAECTTFTIEDNGQGMDLFDEQKIKGVGLKHIESRMQYIGGTMEIDSSPGRGTSVILRVCA